MVFVRGLELTTRPGKVREVLRLLRERISPLLRSQPGFGDELILSADAEPDRILVLTLWTPHDYAERFHRRQYRVVKGLLEPLLEFEPVIRTFNLEAEGEAANDRVKGDGRAQAGVPAKRPASLPRRP